MSQSVDELFRRLSEHVTRVRKRLQHQEQEIRQLTRQVERLRAEQARLRKENEQLRQAYDRMTADFVNLQALGTLSRARRKALNQKLQEYIATIDRCVKILKKRLE